jgi:hypothetical protein
MIKNAYIQAGAKRTIRDLALILNGERPDMTF